MNIAVVDAGTNLKAFIRMDGASLGSIDIAINKPFTAEAFDISTKELGQNSQPRRSSWRKRRLRRQSAVRLRHETVAQGHYARNTYVGWEPHIRGWSGG
jgi:uncharacterized protein GlcG (DUF336 family)